MTRQPSTYFSVGAWGYACFMTVNATSVWGGIFPFLPIEFQTAAVTLTFFLAQSVSFGGAYVASMFGSYFFPRGARRMMTLLSALLLFAGCACLIAAMYLSPLALALVAVGGILLGIGCAGMFMLWQRCFASMSPQRGNLGLMVGTALTAPIYFSLFLVPEALTPFLIPLVFVPLCGLCVSLSVREIDFDQPMFQDVPRQHPRVYHQVIADYWRSALCVGALAFGAGVIRGVALLHTEIVLSVNSSAVVGYFISAIVLLAIWHFMSFRFGLITVFRLVFPLVITGFLLLPFLGPFYVNGFTALMYMVFSLVQMLMMMQCAQVSRDRGINPVFAYGFFGGVVYLLQSLGFLLGWLGGSTFGGSTQWLFFVALASTYGLGITLLGATGTLFEPLVTRGTVTADPIEFLPLRGTGIPGILAKGRTNAQVMAFSKAMEGTEAASTLTPETAKEVVPSRKDSQTTASPIEKANSLDTSLADVNRSAPVLSLESKIQASHPKAEGAALSVKAGTSAQSKTKRRRHRPSSSEDAGIIRDRLSKRCHALQKRYALSVRETEVMELMARGNSVASIAEKLFISENTVRTHSKHIYAKLDIHKRQELLDLVHTEEDVES